MRPVFSTLAGLLGAISQSSGLAVSIDDQTISDFGVSNASATYSLSTDGKAYGFPGGVLENWLDSGAVTDVEVRATRTGGSLPTSGTLGTWQDFSVARSWSVSSTTVKTTQLLIELREAATGNVLDSATITLDAEVGA